MGLDEAADELYGLPLNEFTPRRTLLERQARATGERELAVAIHALAKPSAAAWLVNQVGRANPDEIRAVVALSDEMHDAGESFSGEQLRAWAARERDLATSLLRAARALGVAAGRAPNQDALRAVQESVHAAVVDREAADLLVAGRLSEPLQRVGFVPSTGPAPGPSPVAPTGPGEAVDFQLAKARRDEERARAQLSVARDRSAKAEREHRKSEDALSTLEDEVAQARKDLARLERRTAKAREVRDESAAKTARRVTELSEAQAALDEASARRAAAGS